MQKTLYITLLVLFFSVPSWSQADEEPDEKPQKENWKRREKFNNFFFTALKEKAIGNYDKAIDNLEKCKVIDASDFTLNYEISLNYKYQKDYENAIRYGEQALEQAPNEKWLLYHLNTLYGLKKDYQKRAIVLEKLVDSMPNLRMLYASTLKNIRKYKEAMLQMDLVEKETKLVPSQIGFVISILDRLNNNDVKEKWLLTHYKKFPQELFYSRQLLRFYKTKGFPEKATTLEKELLEKGILKPKKTKQHVALTDILPNLKAKYENQKEYKVLKEILLLSADKKDWKELVKYGQEGTTVFPSQPLVYLLYAVGLNNTAAFRTAARTLESGLDFVIDNPKMEMDFYKQLVIAYNGLGDAKKAKMFQKKLK